MNKKNKDTTLKVPVAGAANPKNVDVGLSEALDRAFKGFDFTTPSYYKKSGLEVFDFLKAYLSDEAFKGFLHGNAIKYLARLDGKDTRASNLIKARHYIDKLLELENEV